MYCWSPTTTPETTVLICDSNTSSTHRRGSDGTSGSDTAFRSTARLLNLKPPLKFPTETLRTLHTPPKTGRPTPKRPRSLSKVESQCQADAIRHRRNHIKVLLEREREQAEHPAHEVHGHERDGDADHFAVLVDFVVLWSIPSCSQQRG